ncbi:hypothetical protein Agub_g2836 [Astrephomene gubernaculifera]|uniref:Isoprenylcysteine carboxyl methyltransferase n=1 Tax=Astrephomene gubernaculifera TaxID=47775 RepID=A0AAD3HIW8_9CHLO|nr:hypothetical protein Agub_g2836 [Astrephomene gubernaculifera]
MQTCIAFRGTRVAIPRHGRVPACRLPHKLLRPSTTSSSKLPASAEREQEPVEKPQEQQPEQQQDVESPVAVEVINSVEGASEAAPVAALEVTSQSSTSESSVEEEAESQGEAAPVQEEAEEAGPASHPLEDVPEEVQEDLIASKELVSEMLDGNSFGKRGEQWLFAQLAAIAMLLFPPLTLKGLVDFCATLALTAGVVFMGTAFLHLGRNLSPLPEPRKKHQLVVQGIYGYVRHPMYGGLLLAALGIAVLTRNETRLAIAGLLWWVLENKVNAEERALSERYPEYAEYKAKVKKFFPFLY